MIWKDLDWKDCHFPVSDDRLDNLEARFGISFPEDFRSFIRACNGGYVVQSDFDFTGPLGARHTTGIGVILRYDTDASDSTVIDAWNGMGPHRDPRVIPFADTGGGDLICLDYRLSDSDPQVVYYDHELGSVTTIAPSFEAFVAMLYTPADVDH